MITSNQLIPIDSINLVPLTRTQLRCSLGVLAESLPQFSLEEENRVLSPRKIN